MNDPQYGEVIEADSQGLTVECHQLYAAPAFGSFIRATCAGSGRDYFAVVTGVSTEAFDSNRIIQAHRLPPGELEERKPHLPSLLRTQFEARLVGYGEGSIRLPGTPPVPPRLHCWVYPATLEEIRDVTRQPTFLRTLVMAQNAPQEDLLVAAIESAREAWGPSAPLVEWGKYLARLLRGQYVMLESVLARLSPVASTVPPPPVSRPLTGDPRSLTDRAPGWEAPLPLVSDAPPANGGHKYSSGQADPFAD